MKTTILAALALLLAEQPLSARVFSNVYTSGNCVKEMVWSGSSIFCATQGGIVQWDTRTMTYKKYTVLDGLPSNSAFSIAKGPDGTVWCGMSQGVVTFDGTSWKPYTQQKLSSPLDIERYHRRRCLDPRFQFGCDATERRHMDTVSPRGGSSRK
jgi:hypothetical protein